MRLPEYCAPPRTLTLLLILNEQPRSLCCHLLSIYFFAFPRRPFLKLLWAHFFEDSRHSFTCLPDERTNYYAAYRKGCIVQAVPTRCCEILFLAKGLVAWKTLTVCYRQQECFSVQSCGTPRRGHGQKVTPNWRPLVLRIPEVELHINLTHLKLLKKNLNWPIGLLKEALMSVLDLLAICYQEV